MLLGSTSSLQLSGRAHFDIIYPQKVDRSLTVSLHLNGRAHFDTSNKIQAIDSFPYLCN